MDSSTLDCSPHEQRSPRHALTFQEYQAIYAELTQKHEGLNKFYEKSYTLKKEHISSLKYLLDDFIKQYNVISCTTNITIAQSDNIIKEYSSIENFLMVATTSKLTESVVIEYNILIQVPTIEKKQNYKITLKFTSDLIAFESLRDTFPTDLLDIIEKNNIELKINYVDYTIAKSLLHSIDDWIGEISDPINFKFDFILKKKKLIANLIKNLIMFFSLLLIYINVANYVSSSIDLQSLAKFFIIAYFVIFCAGQIASWFNSIIRRNLFFLQNYSFIELTEEDKKNIKSYQTKKNKRILSAIGVAVLTILYGVISSIIATKVIL